MEASVTKKCSTGGRCIITGAWEKLELELDLFVIIKVF